MMPVLPGTRPRLELTTRRSRSGVLNFQKLGRLGCSGFGFDHLNFQVLGRTMATLAQLRGG
jgi:hypothetical protein